MSWMERVHCAIGEEELTSFVKRIIQGVYVCHYDRTRTIVRRRSWTRQILSDASESTDWEHLFGNPMHTVIAETKLAMEDQPRMLVKEPLEVECRKILRLVCEY